MTIEPFVQALLKKAKDGGIDPAEVYIVTREGLEITTREGAIENYQSSSTLGLSLRGLVAGRMGYASTQVLDEEAIEMLVRAVKESAALVQSEEALEIFAGSPAYPTVETFSKELDQMSTEEKIALALTIDNQTLAVHPKVRQIEQNALDTTKAGVRLINSYGLDLSYVDNGAMVGTYAVAREDGETTVGEVMAVTRDLADYDVAAHARLAAGRAVEKLGAAPMDSGAYPAVLDREVMTGLLRTFAGVFSAENAQQGLSLLAGREGEAIAAPIVTLMDDPLLPGGHNSRGFDDEGVATRTKAVIEKGVLQTLLHNLKTAKKQGLESTGNGSRAGVAGPVRVAPSNLFIQAGDASLEQLLARAEGGLYVTEIEGMHAGANAVSGDFSLSARGFRIREGKKGAPVTQITVSGNFFSLLKEITALGDDLRFDLGSLASPSALVDKLSVAGK